jgi:hypothetical protein
MAMGKPLYLVTADKSTGPLSYPPEDPDPVVDDPVQDDPVPDE